MKIQSYKKSIWLVCFGLLAGCGEKIVELGVIETEKGRMVVKFYEDVAPKHVESFKILAAEGYFDGTTFHRVIPGFVIQGGDPNTKDDNRMNDGMGGHAGKFYGIGEENDPNTWKLPAEFSENRHVRGVLSMARSKDTNSAGSQFFICVASVFQLDSQYTVFGQVIEGLEVVDRIVNVDTPSKLNPGYGELDKDNPLQLIRMTIRLSTNKDLQIKIPQDL